jgi:hypothetical protein
MNDVARQSSEPQREFAAEVKKPANDGDKPAENQKPPTEIPQRIHKPIIEEDLATRSRYAS